MTDFINFGEEFDTGTSKFCLLDEGTYEFKIVRVEDKASSKSGNPYKKFTLEVRQDVDQKFKGKWISFNISKHEGDSVYDFNRVNKLILTQKNTKNFKTRFVEPDEVWQYLNGKNLRASVENQFDDYTNKDRSQIVDFSWEPSNVEETAVSVGTTTTKAAPATNKKIVEPSTLQDEDLPWDN